MTFNHGVEGSSPSALTNYSSIRWYFYRGFAPFAGLFFEPFSARNRLTSEAEVVPPSAFPNESPASPERGFPLCDVANSPI